jgi:hypothetical protein
VSGWRRKALDLFPERRRSVEAALSVYDLFGNLAYDLKYAYTSASPDQGFIDRVYQFAAWCFEPRQNWELRNAVAVGFYEHLPAVASVRRDFATRLSPDAFKELEPLFRQMLEEADYDAFVREVARAGASTGPQN